MKWIHKLSALFLVKPVLRLFFKFQIDGRQHLKELTRPLLIIGNHKYFLDSFALGAAIPFGADIYPIRTMGETQYFNGAFLNFLNKIGFIKLIYSIFGVFPAIRGQGLDKALEEPVKILKNNGVVFLHPEGEMIYKNEIGQFKRGASALALRTKTQVLPVVFVLDKKGIRRKYHVKFGRPFKLLENLSIEQGADYMRNTIVSLYNTLGTS